MTELDSPVLGLGRDPDRLCLGVILDLPPASEPGWTALHRPGPCVHGPVRQELIGQW